MRAVALASGSNGNAIYVETPDVRLLFDAGLTGKGLQRRAASRDLRIDQVDAIVISHGHHDHVAAAGILGRRYGLPLYGTNGTWASGGRKIGRVDVKNTFRPGETIAFGKTEVHTIPTPHDCPDSVGFVVEHAGMRLGILTDLGHLFPGLHEVFATLDGAFLESNHDPEMLEFGPYHPMLKDRIAGPQGHISNGECVELVRETASKRLRFLLLSHLSAECNSPELALETASGLSDICPEILVAPRDEASPMVVLEP